MNRAAFEAGPFADVDGQAAGDRWTLVFVRDLRHPPALVWAALTDAAQVGEWAPFRVDRDLDSVGDVTLTMIDGDIAVPLPAAVRRAEPPTLLEYTFGGNSSGEADLLRWELVAIAGGTRLTLRHTVADRDGLSGAAAGWHLCLDVAERLLDGRPVGPIRGSEALDFGWPELHDEYARRLGSR